MARQLALYVVLYSPIQMAADLPEHYLQHREAFRFIEDVAVDWEQSRVLDGEVGDYVTIVRRDRNSRDWFLGSITDEHGRVLPVSLGFRSRACVIAPRSTAMARARISAAIHSRSQAKPAK